MSHHISNNDPKQPCQCATPAVSKHNITPKDLEHGGGCGCHPQDLSPSRLDQVIAQYEAMTKEAEAARDEFIQKAKNFQIDEATEEEIDHMFSGIITEDGYMYVRDGWVDSEGYMHTNYRETADHYATF